MSKKAVKRSFLDSHSYADIFTQEDSEGTIKAIEKDENGFERIVYGEILIPDVPNTYGDFHTKASVKQFAYSFMMNGFINDIEHNGIAVGDKVSVVESFIARDNDDTFIPGSWVVGLRINDDDIWQQILDGELNGFSYEAFVSFFDIDVYLPHESVVYGITEPDLLDGHVHRFFVFVDEDGRVIAGSTDGNGNGHVHEIKNHTFTEKAEYHSHIYNVIKRKD